MCRDASFQFNFLLQRSSQSQYLYIVCTIFNEKYGTYIPNFKTTMLLYEAYYFFVFYFIYSIQFYWFKFCFFSLVFSDLVSVSDERDFLRTYFTLIFKTTCSSDMFRYPMISLNIYLLTSSGDINTLFSFLTPLRLFCKCDKMFANRYFGINL